MAVQNLIQPSFSGGIFSPSLNARVDLQKYSSGLAEAKNWIIHPHGGISNRPGLYFVASTKDITKKSRLIPFEFSVQQAYIIEFGDYYCRFYMNKGRIEMSGAEAWDSGADYVVGDYVFYNDITYYCTQDGTNMEPGVATTYWREQSVYEVPTCYSEDDIADLKYVQSADTLYLVHPNYPPKTLSRYAHANWEFDDYEFTGGPFMLSNIDLDHSLKICGEWQDETVYEVGDYVTYQGGAYICNQETTGYEMPISGYWDSVGTGIPVVSSKDLFEEGHIGALFRTRFYMESEAVSVSLTTSVTESDPIECGEKWRLITHGTWAGKIRVEKSTDDGETWTQVAQFTSASDFNPDTYGNEDDPCLVRLVGVDFTSGTCVGDLSTDSWTKTGIIKITEVIDATTVLCSVEEAVEYDVETTNWAEGSWSDYRGFPSCITFFQDRLCMAATKDEPQTIWTSEAGSYNSFARSDPLVDSDGITLNLPSQKMNGIRNMTPLGSIMALTAASEWAVGPDANDAFAPESSSVKCQGYRGCSKVTPVMIGNKAIYVQPMGTVLRDMGYDFSQDGFSGDNLSLYASHLFRGMTIKEMVYQQEPDSIIWCVRSDGALLSCTYLREQEVLAWTWHQTEGEVESIATIPTESFNEVWAVINRENGRFVERIVERMTSDSPRDQFFVDSGLTYDNPLEITGMDKDGTTLTVTCLSHGLTTGEEVDFSDVVGVENIIDEEDMSLGACLNWMRYEVTVLDDDTFTVEEAELENYGDYSSGGNARKVVSVITGLNHLEGQTVSVLGDGSVQAQKTVENGEIALEADASIVQVGLPYESHLETLNLDVQTQNGTAQGRKMIVPSVTVRVIDTLGGNVGSDEDMLEELVQRTTEPLGQPTELCDKDFEVTMMSDYTTTGKVIVKQTDPLPITILAMLPQVEFGG